MARVIRGFTIDNITGIRDDAVRRNGEALVRRLSRNAPVKTGFLRDSFVLTGKDHIIAAEYAVWVDKHRPYISKSIGEALVDG